MLTTRCHDSQTTEKKGIKRVILKWDRFWDRFQDGKISIELHPYPYQVYFIMTYVYPDIVYSPYIQVRSTSSLPLLSQ